MNAVAGPWAMSGKKCTSGISLIFMWCETKRERVGRRSECMAGEELARERTYTEKKEACEEGMRRQEVIC